MLYIGYARLYLSLSRYSHFEIPSFLQVMALEWVQANIESFGGDPSKVTLMGQSAGAASVAMHLISPNSNGLYKKAILQSAGANNRWSLASNQVAQTRSSKPFLQVLF